MREFLGKIQKGYWKLFFSIKSINNLNFIFTFIKIFSNFKNYEIRRSDFNIKINLFIIFLTYLYDKNYKKN